MAEHGVFETIDHGAFVCCWRAMIWGVKEKILQPRGFVHVLGHAPEILILMRRLVVTKDWHPTKKVILDLGTLEISIDHDSIAS